MNTTWNLVLAALLLTTACTDQTGPSETPSEVTDATAVAFQDQVILEKVYASAVSVPDGFAVDPVSLPGQTYTLRHLRATDLDAASEFPSELCTDAMTTALTWSDAATQEPDRTQITTIEESSTLFQITRQAGADIALQRVFKCTYLIRDGVDPTARQGAAGILGDLTHPAAALRQISEYLWHFSEYSNPGSAVLESEGGTRQDGWTHTLSIASRIVNGGQKAGCDRIERVDWHHQLRADGVLTTRRDVVRDFDAQLTAAGPVVCSAP